MQLDTISKSYAWFHQHIGFMQHDTINLRGESNRNDIQPNMTYLSLPGLSIIYSEGATNPLKLEENFKEASPGYKISLSW